MLEKVRIAMEKRRKKRPMVYHTAYQYDNNRRYLYTLHNRGKYFFVMGNVRLDSPIFPVDVEKKRKGIIIN